MLYYNMCSNMLLFKLKGWMFENVEPEPLKLSEL